MKHNVGGWDKNLRFLVGGSAIAAALAGRMPVGVKLGLLIVGAMELVTASAEYCPVNELLGMDTRRMSPGEAVDQVADITRDAAETAMAN